MITDVDFLLQSMAWPLVLLLAWFLAERLYETWHVPRVTSYVAVGLLGGLVNLPGLTASVAGLPFIANVALSLVLFELGYRINLRWFRHNPWVLVLGLVESVITFGAVYWASGFFDLPADVRLIIAALSTGCRVGELLNLQWGDVQVDERDEFRTLFHSYGAAGVLPAVMLRGVPLILVPNPRDIADLVATIERDKPAVFCGVPALFIAVLAHPRVAAWCKRCAKRPAFKRAR